MSEPRMLLNVGIGNLELRSCNKYFGSDPPHVTAEIIQLSDENHQLLRLLAVWRNEHTEDNPLPGEDKKGFLCFVGSNAFRVNWSHFTALARIGQLYLETI